MFLMAFSLIGLIWVLILHLEDESSGRNRQQEKQNDRDNRNDRDIRDSGIMTRFLQNFFTGNPLNMNNMD